MRYVTFLRERIWTVYWLVIWLFTINVFLLTYRGSLWLSIYIDATAVVSFLFIRYVEFYHKRKYYREIENLLEHLDKKYLLPEMIGKARSEEEQAIYEIMREMGKSMTEHVNTYKFSNREYKEYIEMWIHEVKIPIATAKLVIANHKNEVSESIDDELKKIEDYTEQALFYARSNYVEKDYLISDISLQELIHLILMRNKRNLIMKHAQINLHDLDNHVLSDGKWLGFILNQILSNSLKYASGRPLAIEIFCVEDHGIVQLHVKDNGIGILKEDLPMIFEKGFTGNNGRKSTKSTGIGLYLCRKLCNRLGHGITAVSDGTRGSEIILTFSKTNFYDTVS